MSDPEKLLIVTLWLNNAKVSSVYIEGSAHQKGTISMVLELQKGDKVAVKSQFSYNIYSDSLNYSTFSMSYCSINDNK